MRADRPRRDSCSGRNGEAAASLRRPPSLAAPALLAAVAFAVLLPASCANRREVERSAFVLGTVCSIRIAAGGSESALDEAFALLGELEGELSVNKPGSEIDAVNAAAGISPVRVGDDAVSIIARDLEYSRLSGGAFDPSVGPLVKLWGIGTDAARVPSGAEIETALGLVGWRDIELDSSARTVFLRREGMALDLGSTTKGYAADAIASLLRSRGATKAIIDLGGNVLVIGSRPDGSPWRVGLQNPFESRGTLIGVARLADETMVTSGVYERYLEAGGKRYHHILDTTTGYPVDNGLQSVTVIAPRSFDADGLTTTIFALGREPGMELAKARGVAAILVDSDRRVYMTPGLSSRFELTDPSFTYAE